MLPLTGHVQVGAQGGDLDPVFLFYSLLLGPLLDVVSLCLVFDFLPLRFQRLFRLEYLGTGLGLCTLAGDRLFAAQLLVGDLFAP